MKGVLHPFLDVLASGGTLNRSQAEDAMHLLLRGDSGAEEAAALLLGLRSRGETVDELVGFTSVMREYATPVEADPNAIDLCGTGGDSSGTFNISTAAAIVCAGAGVVVAKHGNRSVSSRAGSADVLEALGVHVELGKEGVEYCLHEAGIAFLFAPYFHPAIRYVMPVRRKLGVRTFFNILGPLTNPASVRRQLVGAFNRDTARLMASILHALDSQRVVAVHADDGLDELTLTSKTTVFTFDRDNGDGGITTRTVSPDEHGLTISPKSELMGGTAQDNARILMDILDGQPGPRRDVVVLNSGYALLAAGIFPTIDDAIQAAQESIDSGKALSKLKQLVELSLRAPRP